jgi:hypothetical protein
MYNLSFRPPRITSPSELHSTHHAAAQRYETTIMGWFCGGNKDPVDLAASEHFRKVQAKPGQKSIRYLFGQNRRAAAREALVHEGEAESNPLGSRLALQLEKMERDIGKIRAAKKSPPTAIESDKNTSADGGSFDEPLSPLSFETASVPASCTTQSVSNSIKETGSSDHGIGDSSERFSGRSGQWDLSRNTAIV